MNVIKKIKINQEHSIEIGRQLGMKIIYLFVIGIKLKKAVLVRIVQANCL